MYVWLLVTRNTVALRGVGCTPAAGHAMVLRVYQSLMIDTTSGQSCRSQGYAQEDRDASFVTYYDQYKSLFGYPMTPFLRIFASIRWSDLLMSAGLIISAISKSRSVAGRLT